ncbi:sialidase family protein [Alienimonas californiensis]|uniref:Exo-alpha-sialidase n=1 Tax=Alienimonas californiensis TaxID=2527989 RepID=A0A517PF61_9PLAN|nr:sialidase family protein [Alienimonas californiensis]QDT18008.1 hypothetical protein CA12_41460 [Alienimonas californiensis]
MLRRSLLPLAAVLCLPIAVTASGADPATPDLSGVPGVVVAHSPASSGLYIGSPGLTRLPDGALLASHDFFGPKSKEFEIAQSHVYRSDDDGKTWSHVAQIEGAFWSSLFVHRGDAYLFGTRAHHGDLVLRRSTDGGRTWTDPKDAASGLLRPAPWHCAPVPVVEHDGRLWRGVENASFGKKWGERYAAAVISAPVDADLLNADSWTVAGPLPRDPDWLDGTFLGYLEGNVVVTPDGGLVDLLRVNTSGDNRSEQAALVRVIDDGKKLRFEPGDGDLSTGGFVPMPGAAKKFSVRPDPNGDGYWTLANLVRPEHADKNPGSVRNTLALMHSPDLTTWTVRREVLHHPDVIAHAFQYVDWLYDGDDLIVLSRTAYADGLGGAHRAHDANLLTFHRVENYRDAGEE